MKFRPLTALAVACLGLASPVASAAGPGLFRAYLSAAGNDNNPCTLALPCRLLGTALNAVADGGEVWMLNSANYNSVGATQITKSVTILAVPGVLGSLVANGGPAIAIAVPDLDVTLRNVAIRPLPGNEAGTGILISGASQLTLRDSVVSGFYFPGGAGIRMGIDSPADDIAAELVIADSELRNNFHGVTTHTGASIVMMGSHAGGVFTDIGLLLRARSPAGMTRVMVDRSVFSHSRVGIYSGTEVLSTTATMQISRSVFNNHSVTALVPNALDQQPPSALRLSVSDSRFFGGPYAISAYQEGTTVSLHRNEFFEMQRPFDFENTQPLFSSGKNSWRNNQDQTTNPILPMGTF